MPQRSTPQGLRPVAKRVPGVQRRGEGTCLNLLGGAQSSVHSRESGNPGQRWVPAFAGTNGGENLEAPPIKPETRFGSPTAAAQFTTAPGISQPRGGIPQTESRRVGTRRLPYVGDRVGGLGVRPPALGSVCGD
jgi:hypothetical protein